MRLLTAKSRYGMLLDYIMYETHMKGTIDITVDPQSDMDLINKGHVDEAVKHISPTDIKGFFKKEQFPNYKGDFVKDDNHDYVLVKSKNVVKGTPYLVIQANKKGLVIKHDNKLSPGMWGKVKFERIDRTTLPNTVEELGITNVIPLDGTGKTSTGFYYNGSLTIAKRPVVYQDLDIDKKTLDQYVRGDVIMLPLNKVTSIPGYVQLDKRLLKRKGNEDLYKLIGDEYGMDYGRYGNGQPWRNFNNISATPLPTKPIFGSIPGRKDGLNIGGSAMFATKNRIFTFGGYQGNNRKILTNAFTTEILANGNLKGWTATSALPDPRLYARAVAFCNHVYIIGGTRNVIEGDKPINVLRAKLKTDGTLEKWESLPIRLPRSLCNAAVWVTGRRLYVAGGTIFTGKFNVDDKYGEFAGKLANTYVYYANIEQNGDIGVFKIASALNNPRPEASVIANGSSLSMLSGWTDGYMDTNNTEVDQRLGLTSWSKTTLRDKILPYTVAAISAGNTVHMFSNHGYKAGYKGSDTGITHMVADNNWKGKGLENLRNIQIAYDDMHNRVYFDVVATSSKVICIGGHVGSGTYEEPNPNTSITRDCYMEYSGGKNDYLNYINGSTHLENIPDDSFMLPYIPNERYMIDGKEVVYGFFLKL